ncbi:hypothetical protein [Gracilibacillus salinarum]|uniref:ABC-2 type transport system permease protein n=1 Tax=Gracilibacillus salinarum TaxID=2932255 RepID=A0ABY4GPY4_9BACI|nr:hypothetical protein [Gracilibacillus salinarum]UOQ85387.1 hypothetical protein MUN87_00325 [Gracilibacillus salinarum]
MLSKTSYFKKEIWKQGFRSTGWIGLAYFVILLLLIPLRILMEKSNEDSEMIGYYQNNAQDLFFINGEIQLVLLVTVPVIAGIFACRYLQVKGSADFMHSLPIKRSSLFIHQYLIGITNVLLPLLLIACLMWILHGMVDVNYMYQPIDIASWLYYTIMCNLFFYSFSYLIGMLTGISVVQGGLTYIFLLFPYGISMLILYNLDMLLFGFSEQNANLLGLFVLFSPFYWVIQLTMNYAEGIVTWYYWPLSVICIGLSFMLYRYRQTESASQTLAFSIIKPIFKFGVTICFMLLGGVYFGMNQQHTIEWSIFGYILGALLGYFLAEMLIQKSWRVFNKWRGLAIYSGISMIVLLSIVLDWYGYETKIPEQEDIEGIYFSSGYEGFTYFEGDRVKQPNIMDEALKSQVISLHEKIISDQIGINEQNIHFTNDTVTTQITYYLTNGNEITREYIIPDRTELDPFIIPILKSDAYKQANFSWLYEEDKVFKEISVHGIEGSEVVKDQETIRKIVEALRTDYLNASYKEILESYRYDSRTIQFDDGTDSYYYMPVHEAYDETMQVLKEENLARWFN